MLKDDIIELESEEENVPASPASTQVTRVDGLKSYNDIFRRFLLKNNPCIIKINSALAWESTREWVSHNRPNFTLLKNKFGSVIVPVANCGEKYYNVQKKSQTSFSEYVDYWESYITNGYPSHMPCLYLKDWHFTKDFPNSIIYRVPKYFASDWLNEYFSSRTDVNDDYRFVYMGPKGSWTPLHADVLTSFSWSINICGRKRWLLFPPGQENYLRDKLGNLIYDATSSDLLNENIYPDNQKLTPYNVIQEAGEAMFVPTGWHHQVWNLEDTISINHNWINGCNVEKMWSSMKNNLENVKNEIKDCQDMEQWNEHCQLMLRAVFGMNYEEFCKFIHYIARRRLYSLKNKEPIILYGNWFLGLQHVLFDLRQIYGILINFLNEPDVKNLKFYETSHQSLENICSQIQEILE